MSTSKLYLAQPARLEGGAQVRACEESGEGLWRVRLDQTLFHPQGGGQKADRGWLGCLPVRDVRHAEAGEVDHLVEGAQGLRVGQEVALSVDRAWREEQARYHTGGHLLAALLEARFAGLKAVSGHHWPGEARVELEGSPLPTAAEVEEALRESLLVALETAALVRVVGDPYRSRAVQIGLFEAVPCGGTHVPDLGHLRGLEVERARIKSGRLRVSYGFSQLF